MSFDEPFRPLDTCPVAVGTGLLALDVVLRKGAEHLVRERPGGTCGNVLAVLAHLGWSSHPVGRIGADRAADFVLREYISLGLKLDFVERDAEVGTPVFIHRITRTASGGAVHSFSSRCVKCGRHLPGYRPVLSDRAHELVEVLPPMNVFFFDRVSRGAIVLAEACRRLGAIVVFEPSGIRDADLFQEAVLISHVLKYSGERLGDAGLARLRGPLITIETNGSQGLRYRCRIDGAATRGWVSAAAFPVPVVRDAAGSGDWCTAGILHMLGRSGIEGLLAANEEQVLGAIRFGQALAAVNCVHEGALGAMYDLGFETLKARVLQVLSGEDETEQEPTDDAHDFIALSHHCYSCGPRAVLSR